MWQNSQGIWREWSLEERLRESGTKFSFYWRRWWLSLWSSIFLFFHTNWRRQLPGGVLQKTYSEKCCNICEVVLLWWSCRHQICKFTNKNSTAVVWISELFQTSFFKEQWWTAAFELKNLHCIKVGLSPSKKILFICFNESPLQMMKKIFCFILKAPFVLKIFKFLSWYFGHVEQTA